MGLSEPQGCGRRRQPAPVGPWSGGAISNAYHVSAIQPSAREGCWDEQSAVERQW